jgi:hypothetical protein
VWSDTGEVRHDRFSLHERVTDGMDHISKAVLLRNTRIPDTRAL